MKDYTKYTFYLLLFWTSFALTVLFLPLTTHAWEVITPQIGAAPDYEWDDMLDYCTDPNYRVIGYYSPDGDDYTLTLTNNYAVCDYNEGRAPFRNGTMLSSGPGIYLVNASSTVTGLGDVEYSFTYDGETIEVIGDEQTRFLELTPDDDAVETSPVTFTMTWVVSQEDQEEFSSGIFGVGAGYIRATLGLCPLNTIPAVQCDNGVIDWVTEEVTSTATSTTVTFTSDLPLRNNTDYQANWGLVGANYGNFFGPIFAISETTYFTVGTTPRAGNVRQAVASTTAALRNATTTDAYTVVNSSCNPFSSGFDVGLCIYSVVIPPPSILNTDVLAIKNEIFTVAPMGYITRFISVLTASTTSSLPILRATVPPGIPGANSSLTLDFNHSLDSILNATIGTFSNVSASSTETLYEFTAPYWNTIIYILLAFYLLRRIIGSHIIPEFNREGGVGNKQYGPIKPN